MVNISFYSMRHVYDVDLFIYPRDFFNLQKFVWILLKTKRGSYKIYYLILGLKSYKKFLKRNLKPQFDDVMVCSKIISSSEKNQSLNLITALFKDNAKLKPVSNLQVFYNRRFSKSFGVG